MSPNGFQLSAVSEQMGRETLHLCCFAGGDLSASLSEAKNRMAQVQWNLREGGSKGMRKPRSTMWKLPPASTSPPSGAPFPATSLSL